MNRNALKMYIKKSFQDNRRKKSTAIIFNWLNKILYNRLKNQTKLKKINKQRKKSVD